MVSYYCSLEILSGFSSLLAIIWYLFNLLDYMFSNLLFGLLRFNPLVIVNFNLTFMDFVLLGRGILKGLWFVLFGSSSFVSVGKIGNSIATGSSLSCTAHVISCGFSSQLMTI
jgi:hypothetical protein